MLNLINITLRVSERHTWKILPKEPNTSKGRTKKKYHGFHKCKTQEQGISEQTLVIKVNKSELKWYSNDSKMRGIKVIHHIRIWQNKINIKKLQK